MTTNTTDQQLQGETLLPCPLCGSTDLFLRDIAGWELDCRGCELSLVIADDPSREGLIKRWNTRCAAVAGPRSVVNLQAWTSIDAWLRENPKASAAECLAELVRRIEIETAAASSPAPAESEFGDSFVAAVNAVKSISEDRRATAIAMLGRALPQNSHSDRRYEANAISAPKVS